MSKGGGERTPETVAGVWAQLAEWLDLIADDEVRAQYRVLWRRRFEDEASLAAAPVPVVMLDGAGQPVEALPATSAIEADEGGYYWPEEDEDSARRLMLLTQREMALRDQIADLQADRRDLRAMVKALGFDPKAWAATVTELRMIPDAREETEMSRALYRRVLGVSGPMTEAMLPRMDDSRRTAATAVAARHAGRTVLIDARARRVEGVE